MGQPGGGGVSGGGGFNISPPSYILCSECPFPRYDKHENHPLKHCVNVGGEGCFELDITKRPCCGGYKRGGG